MTKRIFTSILAMLFFIATVLSACKDSSTVPFIPGNQNQGNGLNVPPPGSGGGGTDFSGLLNENGSGSSTATDDDKDGFTEKAGDCNDDNAAINPAAAEICGDNVDENCDGTKCEKEEPTGKAKKNGGTSGWEIFGWTSLGIAIVGGGTWLTYWLVTRNNVNDKNCSKWYDKFQTEQGSKDPNKMCTLIREKLSACEKTPTFETLVKVKERITSIGKASYHTFAEKNCGATPSTPETVNKFVWLGKTKKPECYQTLDTMEQDELNNFAGAPIQEKFNLCKASAVVIGCKDNKIDPNKNKTFYGAEKTSQDFAEYIAQGQKDTLVSVMETLVSENEICKTIIQIDADLEQIEKDTTISVTEKITHLRIDQQKIEKFDGGKDTIEALKINRLIQELEKESGPNPEKIVGDKLDTLFTTTNKLFEQIKAASRPEGLQPLVAQFETAQKLSNELESTQEYTAIKDKNRKNFTETIQPRTLLLKKNITEIDDYLQNSIEYLVLEPGKIKNPGLFQIYTYFDDDRIGKSKGKPENTGSKYWVSLTTAGYQNLTDASKEQVRKSCSNCLSFDSVKNSQEFQSLLRSFYPKALRKTP